jgi:MinD-like ATPase involved in chromosome partitioning or flagellar assembly
MPNEPTPDVDDQEPDFELNSGANPFSSVDPPGTGPFPRLRPRDPDDADSEPEPQPDEPEDDPPPPPDEHSWIPNSRPGSGPFDPRTPVPLPPHGWYAQVPTMEPLPPDPNAFPDPGTVARTPAEAPPLPPTTRPRIDPSPTAAPPPPSAQTAPSQAAPGVQAAPGAYAVPGAQVAPGVQVAPGAQAATPPRMSAPPLPPMVPPPSLRAQPPRSVRQGAEDQPSVVRENADSLTAEALLQGKRVQPGSGWRRTVYRATGGLVRIGESAGDLRHRDLVNRARTPVAGGHHRVAVLSLKGGVGKTTTAVGLGATLASLRGDRVIAVDANPDRGTLSDKVRLETAATVRDLLNERDQVSRYADIRSFTSQSSSRLEVLASDRDPGVSVAFSGDDYRQVCRMLEHYYSICITDSGTGLLHSAMAGVLEQADHIILVSSASVDGARSASATLDWLDAHDCGDLVRDAVVVLSAIRRRSRSTVDLDRLEQHFAARCRAVVRIPYDSHLEEGAEVELDLLSPETSEAYLTLAAIVGDGFAVPRRSRSSVSYEVHGGLA